MSFNYIPVAGSKNRVIVLPDPKEEKTASGIYIPDTAQEKPTRGTVIAVSEIDEEGHKPTVKSGDVVLYHKHSGQELSVDGVSYQIMRESEIFLIKK